MKTTTDAAADGEKTAPTTAAATPLQLTCRVLINGVLYQDAHHAAGKIMTLPKDAAEYLAGQTPPAVEIIGVG